MLTIVFAVKEALFKALSPTIGQCLGGQCANVISICIDIQVVGL